jgi:hypothetical protein
LETPYRGRRGSDTFGHMIERLLLGFITNFFDTLGIGSFAPTTAAFRARRLVGDELIPGTLNVGHTPPTMCRPSFTSRSWPSTG